jgi:hypothetical protein
MTSSGHLSGGFFFLDLWSLSLTSHAGSSLEVHEPLEPLSPSTYWTEFSLLDSGFFGLLINSTLTTILLSLKKPACNITFEIYYF